MYSKSPLFDVLVEIKNRDINPMHMPGHKRNILLGERLGKFFQLRVGELDFTEIPGLDDLNAPEGVIGEAQRLAAECFGTRHTFFLVNGGTAGIHAAVMACCGEGDEIAVPRNAHRSIYEGLVLTGAKPLYYRHRFDSSLGIPLAPDYKELKNLLKGKNLKALILLHPTYHGMAAELSIIQEAQSRGITVIVDEAHGAHFKFDRRLPMTSLEAGGDVVIHGTHKTLGSLTQTGLLHLGTEKVDPRAIQRCLALLQTTSPSYILMASLDAMRHDLTAMGRGMVGSAVDAALALRKEINNLPGFFCFEPEKGIEYDPTKVVLCHDRASGYSLGRILREKYGIYPEVEAEDYVLLMVTIGDTEKSVGSILGALKGISAATDLDASIYNSSAKLPIFNELPEAVLAPRDAFFYNKRNIIPLSQSCGRICGQMVVLYPPGVPVVLPGERISKSIVEYLSLIISRGIHVQGIRAGDNPEIEILEC